MNNLEKIAEACRYLLQQYPEAAASQEYLDYRLDRSIQDTFQIGYFPPISNIEAITSLIGEDILKEEGFLFTKEIEDSLYPRILNFCYFEDHSVIIPFRDCYGEIAGLVGRTTLSDYERKNREKEVHKYKNSYFSKTHHVFGLYENKKAILEKDCVFIVEGQIDVIKAREKGFDNIVGIGSASLSMQQFSLITRYTTNIILLLDGDEAGTKGRKRIIDKFGKYANIQNFHLPEGYKDIDEYLKVVSYENMELIVSN
jgi:DNA primase